MSNPSWKQTERAVAARLGGRRVPVSGRARGDAPDIAHPLLAIECKHRRTLPGWLTDAMRQAEAAARGDQLPVAILHERGRRHEANLCLMSMTTLRELLDRAAGVDTPSRSPQHDSDSRRFSREE